MQCARCGKETAFVKDVNGRLVCPQCVRVAELEARVAELEEWQAKVLDHFPKPLRIDAAFVARVEERMGCGHTAWDTVDPAMLCKAVLLESGR